MGQEQLLLGLGAVVIIIAGIFAFKAFFNDVKGKEEAKEFLTGLEDKLYKIFVDILAGIDPEKFNTLQEYEDYALSKIYDGVWEYIEQEIQKSENSELISVLAKKFLTKEYIDKFIKDYLFKINTDSNLENTYGATVIANKYDELVKEDKELAEQYSDQNQFNEEVDKNEYEYAAPEEPEHTQEEIDALNPQQDIDQENYEENDDSVEVITDYIEETVNKAGKKIYYLINELGKKKIISKQKAIESGLEIRNMSNEKVKDVT